MQSADVILAGLTASRMAASGIYAPVARQMALLNVIVDARPEWLDTTLPDADWSAGH